MLAVSLGGQNHLSQLPCGVETCPRWCLWTDGGGHELWMGTQNPAGSGRGLAGKRRGGLVRTGRGYHWDTPNCILWGWLV